jgi:NH3-dependent NAD+ synthetase
MGFFSFIKNVFGGEDEDEKELDAARVRHGITVDKKEMNKKQTEEERFAENYDVWDDLKNYRSTFFMGSWVNKKFRPVGEDKVKKQLEELEKKRQAEAAKKRGEE